MNKREKTLALIVGLSAAAYGGKVVVWPVIEESVLGIADQNDELRAELEERSVALDDIIPYRDSYRDLMARTGATKPADVQNALHTSLTNLIAKAGLSAKHRISPRNITDYKPPNLKNKKAGIKLVRFNVTAEGKLDALMGFLKSCYELSYVLQITEFKLDPPSTRDSKKKVDDVKMTASVEALVPPANKTSEVNIKLQTQPERHVKHSDYEYALVSARKPFTEYVEPPKPPVRRPDPPKPPERTVEAPVVTPPEPEPDPPPPPVDDPNRNTKFVRMVMMHDDMHEVFVVNTGDNTSEYVGLGDKLDGGDVVLVHPLGAAARRDDGSTRLYPIGKRLADCLPIEDAAMQYAEVAYAYDKIKDTLESIEEIEEDVPGESPEEPAAIDPATKPENTGKTGAADSPSKVPLDKPAGQANTAAAKVDAKPPAAGKPAEAEKEPQKPARGARERARDQRRGKTATEPASDAKKGAEASTPAAKPAGGKTTAQGKKDAPAKKPEPKKPTGDAAKEPKKTGDSGKKDEKKPSAKPKDGEKKSDKKGD